MDEAKPRSNRTRGESGLSSSKLLQYLVAGVTAFVSLAGGVYLGFSTAMESAATEQLIQSRQSFIPGFGRTASRLRILGRHLS